MGLYFVVDGFEPCLWINGKTLPSGGGLTLRHSKDQRENAAMVKIDLFIRLELSQNTPALRIKNNEKQETEDKLRLKKLLNITSQAKTAVQQLFLAKLSL